MTRFFFVSDTYLFRVCQNHVILMKSIILLCLECESETFSFSWYDTWLICSLLYNLFFQCDHGKCFLKRHDILYVERFSKIHDIISAISIYHNYNLIKWWKITTWRTVEFLSRKVISKQVIVIAWGLLFHTPAHKEHTHFKYDL